MFTHPLTMRRVAEELNAEAMSLYYYVASSDRYRAVL